MPHLVEMHRKFAKDGLVVITVALDSSVAKKETLDFLKAQKATCLNLLLDEEADLWSEKLDILAPPAQYVFDRQGRWTRFRAEDRPIRHEDVEKVIRDRLQEK